MLLVIIEANGEYNSADVPKVLAPILNGEADLVAGSRFLGGHKNKIQMPLSLRIWRGIWLWEVTIVIAGDMMVRQVKIMKTQKTPFTEWESALSA
jgi:hypothetical protein